MNVCANVACASPLSGVTAIAVGQWHTCAVITSGGVKCWGGNYDGQMGDGTNTDRHTPVDVCADSTCISALSGVRAIATGSYHICAITSGGEVKCWGDNHTGNLGDGTTTQRTTPVDVCADAACASPLSGMRDIAGGWYHTCALTANGGVKCWGINVDGELGDGTNTDRHTPVDVVGLGTP